MFPDPVSFCFSENMCHEFWALQNFQEVSYCVVVPFDHLVSRHTQGGDFGPFFVYRHQSVFLVALKMKTWTEIKWYLYNFCRDIHDFLSHLWGAVPAVTCFYIVLSMSKQVHLCKQDTIPILFPSFPLLLYCCITFWTPEILNDMNRYFQ